MAKFSRPATSRILFVNLIGALLVIGLAAIGLVRRAHSLDELIIRVSRHHGMDPRLISAVIWKESRFDRTAVGAAGEIGLMQVMPLTAMEWAGNNHIQGFTPAALFNPETNLHAGVWYLRKAITDWSSKKDPLPYALAQYNAGRSNVIKWDASAKSEEARFFENIKFETTARYVRDILIRYRQ